MIFAEIVGYSFGGLCVATSVPLSFRKVGGGSGSLEAFGVKVAGPGMAALFLLVGAAMILVVVGLSMTRQDLREKKEELGVVTEIKDHAVRVVDELSTELQKRSEYVEKLEARLPPQVLEDARAIRPRMEPPAELMSPEIRAELSRLRAVPH